VNRGTSGPDGRSTYRYSTNSDEEVTVSTPRTLTVFDPPTCCSSGLCGPDVDPTLVRFSDALFWLARHGVGVTRHNLPQEPGADG
jgi:hypothetical protein